ncbi:MAG TPA: hypothetical protein V7792_00920 [Candidatus Azoamicus sp. OHIO2]
MFKIFFYLKYLLNSHFSTNFLIFNCVDKNIFTVLLKSLVKTILCTNRKMAFGVAIACNNCLSCMFFYNKQQVDFLICDFRLFNEDFDEIVKFVNTIAIYSNFKVLLIRNLNMVNIKKNFLMTYLLENKKKTIFFIFVVENVFFVARINYVFLLRNKKNLYLRYLKFKKTDNNNVFLLRHVGFLMFKLVLEYSKHVDLVKKIHDCNQILILYIFLRFNINLFAITVLLEKNIKILSNYLISS